MGAPHFTLTPFPSSSPLRHEVLWPGGCVCPLEGVMAGEGLVVKEAGAEGPRLLEFLYPLSATPASVDSSLEGGCNVREPQFRSSWRALLFVCSSRTAGALAKSKNMKARGAVRAHHRIAIGERGRVERGRIKPWRRCCRPSSAIRAASQPGYPRAGCSGRSWCA
jgi:hypothetical protein